MATESTTTSVDRLGLAPGTRLYVRPTLCNQRGCSCRNSHGGQSHGHWVELHLPGDLRRYVGDLVAGRENLPILVERRLVELAGDDGLPSAFEAAAGKLAQRRDRGVVGEVAEAVIRAGDVLSHSRFIIREQGFQLGDLLALPRSATRAISSGRPLLLVALPTGPGHDQQELVAAVRDIVARTGSYDENVGAAIQVPVRVSANAQRPLQPLISYFDERLAVFTCYPDTAVIRHLRELDGQSFAAKLRQTRSARARPSYHRPPRKLRLVLPLVARVNDASSKQAGLLRIDRDDAACLALFNDRLATAGATYPVLCEVIREMTTVESSATKSGD